MGFAASALRACPFVGPASGAILVALLLIPSAGSASPALALERTDAPSPDLSIDPPSWWMAPGNVTTFTASWADSSPGCTLTPEWFRWSVSGGTMEGWVAPTDGPATNFTSASALGGTTAVMVRSLAVQNCSAQSTPFLAMAEATISVASPIAIRNLTVGPNPVVPGEPVVLSGSVSGGEPPYELWATWGDGTVSVVPLARPGPVALIHSYRSGSYLPGLRVSDSTGAVASAAVAGNLQSSTTPAIGITGSRTETDVGAPIAFNVSVVHPPSGYLLNWSCGDGAGPSTYPPIWPTNLWCQFPVPGPTEVSAQLITPGGSSPITATFSVNVEPLPSLAPLTSTVAAEAGRESPAVYRISGGVPPFDLDWTAAGSGAEGTATVLADGTVLLPLGPSVPGSFRVVTSLVDSDGAAGSNSSVQLVVAPALNDSASLQRARTGDGEEFDLAETISGGTPPFEWVISPGLEPVPGARSTGTLDSAGSFDWTAVFAEEGTTDAGVFIVDAEGAFTISTFVLGLVTPFSGVLSLDGGAALTSSALSFDLTLAGGLAPFTLQVNASDGENWNRSFDSDGVAIWSVSPHATGRLDLRVDATDALGYRIGWNETVELPDVRTAPGPLVPVEPPIADSLGPVVLVVIAVALAVFYVYRRRKVRTEPMAPVDPEAVLRGIVEPADGADRVTVELLAEEAGVPLDVVRSTIDRLVASGSVRSEVSADGEEVISWEASPAS
jgi:hypothetical protein